jgi:uncharacterized protein (DUF486 family)
MKVILVPLMLFCAGLLISFAWIGHLRFKSWGFWTALAVSWFLVLPAYVLNVSSARWGRDVFSGAQMASMHLGCGVVCVALVSKFHLGESLIALQLCGFALMGVAVVLITIKYCAGWIGSSAGLRAFRPVRPSTR